MDQVRSVKMEPGEDEVRRCSIVDCNNFVYGARHKVRCNECQTRWVQQHAEGERAVEERERRYGDYEGYGGHGEAERKWREWGEDWRREAREYDEGERERELAQQREYEQRRAERRPYCDHERFRGPNRPCEQQQQAPPEQMFGNWIPAPPPHPAHFLRQLATVMPWSPGRNPNNAAHVQSDQNEAEHRRDMERRQQYMEERRVEREQEMEARRMKMAREREMGQINLERARYLYGSKGAEREVRGKREE